MSGVERAVHVRIWESDEELGFGLVWVGFEDSVGFPVFLPFLFGLFRKLHKAFLNGSRGIKDFVFTNRERYPSYRHRKD